MVMHVAVCDGGKNLVFQLKAKDILDKYDEEIHGEKKESFVLGESVFIQSIFLYFLQILHKMNGHQGDGKCVCVYVCVLEVKGDILESS